MYDNENSKGFDVSSDVLQEIVSKDGYIAVEHNAKIKPIKLGDNGKVNLKATVYKKGDSVTPKTGVGGRVKKQNEKTKNYNELNKMFDDQETNIVVNGYTDKGKEIRYYRDEKGNIYKIQEDSVTREFNADWGLVKDDISPYFYGLDKTFSGADEYSEFEVNK